MNPLRAACLMVCLAAALVSPSAASAAKISPCPDLFQYVDGGDEPQQWQGVLNFTSDHELQGLWIRVKFNARIKELTVQDKFGEVISRSPNDDEFLIKKPEYLLKPKTPLVIRIKVKYEGNKAPNLIGYRLNAHTVCPEQFGDPSEVFKNDLQDKDFLHEVLYKKPIASLPNYECGISSPKSEYPWRATIQYKESEKSRYLCQGTLITPKHVITAAHCVTYRESAGHLSPALLSLSLGQSELAVAAVTVHPGYKFTNLLNDVAVVELSAPVAIDDSVRPICLGDALDDAKTVVVGYSLDKVIPNEISLSELKEISHVDCEKRLGELSPLINDNSLCAVYNSDKPNCVGDSGSGVAQQQKGKSVWSLRGIVSLGVALQNKNECNASATVLLTDVSRYLRWIRASTF